MLTSADLKRVAKTLASNGRGVSGIPEIAKAYQNDPRTQLAVQAMSTGASTAPVAQGKYAYADGIARALQGALGGYIDRRQQDKYGARTDAAMNAQRTAALASMSDGSETPDPLAPQTPAVAPQIASALGAPPPMAPAPVAPVQAPPSGIPAMPVAGGQPGGKPPFPVSRPGAFDLTRGKDALVAGGATVTSGYRTPAHNAAVHGVPDSFHTKGTPDSPEAYDFRPRKGESIAQLQARARKEFPGYDVIAETDHVHVEPSKAMVGTATRDTLGNTVPPPPPGGTDPFAEPTPAPVPDVPAPMARPTAPQTVAATKSPLLKAAYQLMLGGTEDTYGNAQRMYEKGLSEQTDLNEAAAGREQETRKMGYSNDLSMYAHSQEAAEAAKRAERAGVILNNQKDLDSWIAWERSMEKDKRDNAARLAIAGVRSNAVDGGLTDEERAALNKAASEKKIDIAKLTRFQAKQVASALVSDPSISPIALHALATLDANPTAQSKAGLLAQVPELVANVRDAGKKLNYSGLKVVGGFQKWAKGQTNNPDYVNYMTQRNDLMMTLAGVMRQAQATDMSTKLESEAAHPTLSPDALDGWMQGQLMAVKPRLQWAESKGLVEPGTVAKMEATYGAKPTVAGAPGPYKDPAKEQRYQEYLKAHPNG